MHLLSKLDGWAWITLAGESQCLLAGVGFKAATNDDPGIPLSEEQSSSQLQNSTFLLSCLTDYHNPIAMRRQRKCAVDGNIQLQRRTAAVVTVSFRC